MSTKVKIFIFPLLILFIISCRSTRTNTSKVKSLSYRAALETKQFFFTFPTDSFAFIHREELIKECENALNFDLKILKLDSFPHLIRVHYYNSRADLWKYINMTPSGTVEVWKNTIYLVRNKESKAPTRHEMMHLLSGKIWGYPPQGSYWINEGLAAYAANTCNGFNVEQIYSYLSDKKMLISLDSLSASFYSHEEMIAYHQSAYVIQWLLEHYEIDKLKQLWQSGFEKFENIYGVPYRKVESDIEAYLRGKYPTPTDINWNTFKIGCR